MKELTDHQIIQRGELAYAFINSSFYKEYLLMEFERVEADGKEKLLGKDDDRERGKIQAVRDIQLILREWVFLKEQKVKESVKNESKRANKRTNKR